jgi:glycosyltransferase involved in cell wall biosynthesis
MIPRTCIIVPYYQSSDFYRPGLLKRAIDSINFCTQGIEDKVKMLLVDDGSEFDPPEVIGREVLHLDHQGVSSAINQAMKVAMEERMGDKILILHDDDMLSQGVVRALHSSTSDGFSLSDLYAFVEGRQARPV